MAKLKIAVENEIKIDKGVPMDPRHGRTRYPFRQMEVGDSFVFPTGYKDSHYYGMARDFTSQCTATGQNWAFKTKKTPEGYRCWRVK